MQSPKFAHKVSHLQKIVAGPILATLWKKKNGVRDHMRKQIVPDSVEFLDFHIQHRQRCNSIEALICAGGYLPSPILRMRVEKGKGLCRQVALPAPEEALVLQALSNSLWREIEQKSPSKTAFFAPQDQPFEKRHPIDEEDEWGYGPIESWLDFQQEILHFSQNRTFVVVTDIANYYDCIIHTFLRSILADYGLEREYALDLLLFILDAMLWRPDYMPNFGIGLPQMNLDAPRLLAHTHLFEIDELFSNRLDVDFARYMDDMDFGVDTMAMAKTVLRDLDLALHTRNIRVNSGKTKILTATQALIHFRQAENLRLTKLAEDIARNFYLENRERIYRRLVSRLIDRGVSRGSFEEGNGNKILKRLLGLALRLGAPISDASFRAVIYTNPALRDVLLRAWARSPDYVKQMGIVVGYLASGQSIDDFSKVSVATAMSGAIHDTPIPAQNLFELFFSLRGDDHFLVFARLWLISRLETRSRLWDEIRKTQSIWSRHSFLGRTVAGFSGLLRPTPHFADFNILVRRWGGSEALSVLDFHEQIASSVIGYRAVYPFLEASNPSIPAKISHSKTLLLASALWNAAIPKGQRARLLGLHNVAMADHYYRLTFSHIITNAP